jgi:hypothetical protein
METIINIERVDIKATKAGKTYAGFKTNIGQLNCFDEAIVSTLRNSEGKTIRVEIEEKNGFKNIKKYLGVSEVPVEKVCDKTSYRDDKEVMMMTSYAKDVFIAILPMFKGQDDIHLAMGVAVKLVKSARAEFEKKEGEQ